jgi:hydroxyacylglutathione hydrolase
MINITPIPAFRDNYIWAIDNGQCAVVVDPGDAEPVIAWLTQHGLKLSAILVTHHHNDHTGGICELSGLYNARVYGPQRENIPCMTAGVGNGDAVALKEPGITLKVLDISGHTKGHVAYLMDTPPALFCGDTLFGCGCGRLFEGTAAQLHASLQRLASLPDAMPVYCAHEYTEMNIRFARACEPGNAALKTREADARALREAGKPTLPSSIGLEKATNPFLRCAESEVVRSVEAHFGRDFAGEVELFAALREWRNNA